MEQLMSITSIASESSDFMNNCPTFMPANCSTKFPIDAGFIERAARHSSFSFGSCREAQSDNLESDKLSRVPSSQSLKSKENSSLTDLGLSSRKKHNVQKRKAEPKNKAKLAEESSLSAKKYRPTETSDKKVCFDLKEGINKGSELAEPPKDYIHVRARSGQATDSHSLAERVRRERISQRMKLLQDLVPGCNKITGKALMLDEIINYVQSLQRQVELLSMKLATFKPQFDGSLANFMSKEFHPLMSQTKASILCSVYPLDNSAVNSPCYQSKEGKAFPKGMETRSFLSLADDTLYQTTSCMPPTSLDVFGAAGSQVGNICDYDLHGIAQMNLMLNQEIGFNYQTFMQGN